MDPFAIYAGLVVLGLVIFAVAALLSPSAKRRCPGCDKDLATTARLCRRCGYAFT
jgi:predicted amidophosphoribosyltransferase